MLTDIKAEEITGKCSVLKGVLFARSSYFGQCLTCSDEKVIFTGDCFFSYVSLLDIRTCSFSLDVKCSGERKKFIIRADALPNTLLLRNKMCQCHVTVHYTEADGIFRNSGFRLMVI